MQPAHRSIGNGTATWLAALLLGATAFAGGTPENALLIVDPSNPESMYVANYYKAARDIPDANFVYMTPGATNYAQFVSVNREGFLGSLENLGVEDHVDYVVIPPGGSFFMGGPGTITDMCAPVSRFATPTGYTLAHQKDLILAGLPSTSRNHYWSASWEALPFDASTPWWVGSSSTLATAERYFIGTMLGYTGTNGNTLAEVLALIDRSVAVDGTLPSGTFYFMETTDPLRSGPRDFTYDSAVTNLAVYGGTGAHLFANLPLGNHDVLGIMTGFAVDNIDGADMTILPGAFCDHLTSFAATFDDFSQTKMSRWIAKGASGTSGTVEEPCNYSSKFPRSSIHVVYYQGLSLGESWFRSLIAKPFQQLFTGDPLTRPWASFPTVSVTNLPGGPVGGIVTLDATATATASGATIGSLEMLVDGKLAGTALAGESFALDTTVLADGWHELRVLAYDTSSVKNVGRFVGAITTDNAGLGVTASSATSTGNLSTRFDFTVAAAGGIVSEVRLIQNGRVVAALPGASGVLSVHGQNLGAGPLRVQAEARFADGGIARCAPIDLDVDYSSGAPSGVAPLAFSYTKRVLDDESFVLELPASYDDAPSGATYALLSSPAQSTILGGSGPYRVLAPSLGAAGSDVLTFQVTTASGSSSVATVTIEYVVKPVVTPYGSGINPTESLSVLSGAPRIGQSLTLGIDNPLGTQAAGALPFLFISTLPDANYPSGTPIPNFGMGGAGAPGELLVSLVTPDPFFVVLGPAWTGPGTPSPITLEVPADAALVGLTDFAQALLLDPSSAFGVKFGLTEALAITIGN